MKVRQLIAKLTELPGDTLVVMAMDQEGNAMNVLEDVADNNRYDDGETGLDRLTPELVEEGYEEGDLMEGGVPCVVLWP